MRRFRHVPLCCCVPLPDAANGTVVGDRLFEAISEGMTCVNLEMMRSGLIPDLHPYSDVFGVEYELDPSSIGVVQLPGEPQQNVTEMWSNAGQIIKRKSDDCESLSQWLAAWYRFNLGVHARAAIYPSLIRHTASGTFASRHVVVFVPLSAPVYNFAPWDSDKFIRVTGPNGYIEDPSVALGMRYKLPSPREMPVRARFPLDPSKIRRNGNYWKMPTREEEDRRA